MADKGKVVGPYLRDNYNRLDFLIVIGSIFSFILKMAQLQEAATLVGTIKVVRPLRFINKMQGLKLAVKCLASSMTNIMNAFMFLVGFIMIFSIFMVNYFAG